MNDVIKFFSWVAAATTGLIVAVPSAFKALVVVMLFDIIVGSIAAGMEGKLSKTVAWNGVSKKIVTICLIGLCYVAIKPVAGAQITNDLAQMVTAFYIYVESISILENAIKTGIPIPEILKKAIQAITLDNKQLKLK